MNCQIYSMYLRLMNLTCSYKEAATRNGNRMGLWQIDGSGGS